MKKAALVGCILVLFAVLGFAQNLDSTAFFLTDQKSAESFKQNKNIGLSHITTDIITFEQFLSCNEVTIQGRPDVEIDSFYLLYFLPNDDIKIYFASENKIPLDIIESIIAEGVDKILIENIIVRNNPSNELFGSRYFNLK